MVMDICPVQIEVSDFYILFVAKCVWEIGMLRVIFNPNPPWCVCKIVLNLEDLGL